MRLMLSGAWSEAGPVKFLSTQQARPKSTGRCPRCRANEATRLVQESVHRSALHL